MALRITLTLLMTVVTMAVAGRRIAWLVTLIRSGAAAPGRGQGAGPRVANDAEEVLGQRKLLMWSVPGLAHFFTFWGFIVLGLTILEAYGALLINRDFHIPLIGKWQVLGFLEDFFAVAVLIALGVFTVLRLRNAPERKQRESRFYGSHTGPAWVILGMITLVILTLLGLRGAQMNAGRVPVRSVEVDVRVLRGRPRLFGAGDYNKGLATVLPAGPGRGGAGLPGHRHLLQAPAHRHRADQRVLQATAQGARPAAAGRRPRRQGHRLHGRREPVRGHRLRQGQDRGLHLEGLPGLRDLHRVRPLPVASVPPGTPASRCRRSC